MCTVTNLLLLNLAVADACFLLMCGPLSAYKYAAPSWGFGDAGCKLYKYFEYWTTYVTVYTLVAISVLRSVAGDVVVVFLTKFTFKKNIVFTHV